jgi:hypothetical protein
MFVPGKLFQSSLMFAGKAKAYLSCAHIGHKAMLVKAMLVKAMLVKAMLVKAMLVKAMLV